VHRDRPGLGDSRRHAVLRRLRNGQSEGDPAGSSISRVSARSAGCSSWDFVPDRRAPDGLRS
jgi:hypothetical protein